MASISWLIPELSNAEWLAHASVFVINIALLIFAKPILSYIESGQESESKVKILRYLNVLVLILQAVDIALLGADSSYENYFIKAGLTLMAIYASLMSYLSLIHI